MPSLLLLVPLAALILINLPLKGLTRRLGFSLALLVVLFQLGLSLWLPAASWGTIPVQIASLFSFSLTVDNLTLVMLLSIALVAFAALLVGNATLGDPAKKNDFVSLLLLALAGMNGVVLTNDLFSLYVFLEITAVASFILIAFHRLRESLEGAFKYIVLSAVATVMMLTAIALFLMTTGSTSFAAVGAALKTPPAGFLNLLAIGLFVGGLFIKGGLVPFHGWLPDAYQTAPAGVSVLLAGIVTKTTGIYTLIRLVTAVFGFTPAVSDILLVVGTISIFVGALAALGQKDLKRMLAYSSISQVGYIVLSLGAGTPLGIAGAVFHLFNHSVFKAQLFVNAAAVEEQTGTRDMDKLGGLTAKMPYTGYTSVVGLLSTAGIPPLGGFWSKIVIVIALWSAGHAVYAVLAILASVITLAYFLSMQRRVFFGKLAEGLENLKEAPAGVVLPEVILALITVAVGVLFPLVLNTYILPVRSIFG